MNNGAAYAAPLKVLLAVLVVLRIRSLRIAVVVLRIRILGVVIAIAVIYIFVKGIIDGKKREEEKTKIITERLLAF